MSITRSRCCIVAIAALALSAFVSSRADDDCKVVDLFGDQGKDHKAIGGMLGPSFDWCHHAKVCSVGPFKVYGPADGSDHNLLVTEGDNFVVSVSPTGVMVFEGKGRLVASLGDDDHDGRFDSLAYLGRDKVLGDVDAFDKDLDGRSDVMTFKRADGSTAFIFQIEGVWVERVKQNGKSGFVIGGQFVETKAEAAERLRARHVP